MITRRTLLARLRGAAALPLIPLGLAVLPEVEEEAPAVVEEGRNLVLVSEQWAPEQLAAFRQMWNEMAEQFTLEIP